MFKSSIAGALGALIICVASVGSLAEETTALQKTPLFVAKDLGFTKCRIPGIAVTSKGTLIAWCEARMVHAGDWDPSMLFISRSTDGGATWDAPHKIAGDGKQPFNNPVMISDRDTGDVHLFFCNNYERCFHMISHDDGQTFSDLKDITDLFTPIKNQWDWKVIATGPNHGIQLRSGRLLTPVWLSTTEHRHYPNSVTTLFSDDHGKTWQTGDLAIKNSETFPSPNETVAVELADGRVMLNARQGNPVHRRAVVIGKDGASGWGEPQFDDALLEPRCNASMVRYSFPTDGKPGVILFANPHNVTEPATRQTADANGIYPTYARKNLSIQLSYDDGKTWPLLKTIEPGSSGYSDLAVTPNGTIVCVYEAKSDVVVARFPLSWIEQQKQN
jgi:sialidase-1